MKKEIKSLIITIFYATILFALIFIIAMEQYRGKLCLVISTGIVALALTVYIFYLCFKRGKISGRIGIYWIVWLCCALYAFSQRRMDVVGIIFLGIPAIAVFLYPRWGYTLTMKRYYGGWIRFFLGLISIYYSFALTGNELFMQETRMNLSYARISLFVLYTVALYPSIYAAILAFEWLAKKARNLEPEADKRKVILAGIACGITTSVVLLIFAYGFYPAGMSNDSISHWTQAHGYKIADNHPIAFTLLIQFLSGIYNNPFVFVIFQIIFFSFVAGSLFAYLREKGLPLVYLVPCAVIIGILPNNYTEVAYLSKNPLFAIINLWLIVLLVRLFECPDKSLGILSRKKLLVCLIALYLIRFNNIPAFIAAIVAFIYLTVRFYKVIKGYLIDIAISSMILIVIIVGPIYDAVVETHVESYFLFNNNISAALGCALINDVSLPEDTLEIMEKVLPLEMWKERFRQHNFDAFVFANPIPDMYGIDIQEYVRAYGRLFVSEPDIVIKSWLDMKESLWNISMAKTSYNRRFYYGVPANMPQELLPTEMQGMEPENGLYPYKTATTSFAVKFADWTTNVKILDILIWRSGIYIVLLLCFMAFIAVNHQFDRIFIILPTCMTIGTYVVLLGWQIYAYTYFIGIGIMAFIVMTLLSLSVNKH